MRVYDKDGIIKDTAIVPRQHSAVTLATSADVLLGVSAAQQLSLDTQTANMVLSGPATGANAAPTFRAMVAADLVAHNVLSASHGDSTAAAAVRGDVITGQGASPKWVRLAISAPAATFMNYLGAANGDTEPGYKALFDATVPGTIAESAAAAAGTATVAARRDHIHGAPATWASTAHDIVSAHTYTGGAALDVFGLSAANTIATLTPSSAPGATSAILKSAADGSITLVNGTFTGGVNVGSATGAGAGQILAISAGSGGYAEVARFGGATYSYITIGNGATATTGGYVMWDDTLDRLNISRHGTIDVYINASGPFNAADSLHWTQASDSRLKHDIVDLSGALDIVRRLKPRKFVWNDSGIESIGFVAQELAGVFPNAVSRDSTGILSHNGGPIHEYLTAAVQEVDADVIVLEARIAALEKQLAIKV